MSRKVKELDHHAVIGRGYCPKHGYYVLSIEGCPVCNAIKNPRNSDVLNALKKHRRNSEEKVIYK